MELPPVEEALVDEEVVPLLVPPEVELLPEAVELPPVEPVVVPEELAFPDAPPPLEELWAHWQGP